METIKSIFNDFGINIDDEKCSRLSDFYKLLIEKNKVMNLTSITDEREVYIKHFLDSCAIVRFFDLDGDIKVVDMGTGAGFPGIPLKILLPDLDVTLVDSLNKRLLFLNDV